MIPRFPVTAFLVVALSTLGPLAHARPPDPTWIGGFYDAADYDDVVLAVTGMDPAPQPVPVVGAGPRPILLGRVALSTRQAGRPVALTAAAIRATPLARVV